MTPQEVAQKIADMGGRSPRRSGANWSVRCPAHEDRNPSLSVGTGQDGKVLITCHAGCPVEAVLAAAGLAWADMFIDPPKGRSEVVAEYTYTDQFDKPVFQVRRYFPKDFRAYSPDGRGGWRPGLNGARRVLYRLPKVIAAVKAGQDVYVVEGEKDVHAIEAAGGVATTSPFGAGKWQEEYADVLVGGCVTVVADNDQAGMDHAVDVARSLHGRAKMVSLVRPAGGKDASDHLAAGRGLNEFVAVTVQDEGSVDFVTGDKASTPTSAGDAAAGWEEPVPLEPVVPAFPVEALPPVLSDWVTALSTALQVPTDLAALQTLSALSLAVSKKYVVVARVDWVEPVNLYTVTVLASGMKKSPVFRAVIEPIEQAEEQLDKDSKGDRARQGQERRLAQARLDKAERAAISGKGSNDAARLAREDLELTPEPPPPPRLLLEDVTPEAIPRHLAGQHGRGGMFSDEGGIFGTLIGRYSNGVSNLDTVLKAFDGSTIRVDRISREPDYVSQPALTFGLSVQPIVLAGVTECHPEIRDRGLLARFVSAIPDVTFGPVRVGYREIEPPPVPPGVRERYHRLVRHHAELEVPDEPTELRLKTEASVLFTAWRRALEERRRPDGTWLSSRRGRRRSTGKRCVSPPSCTSRSTHQAPSSPP